MTIPSGVIQFEASVLVEVAFSGIDRGPYRAAHLAHIAAFLASGTLKVAGATADAAVSVMLFTVPEPQARAAVESDPYWQSGVWESMRTREFLHAVLAEGWGET